MSPCQCCRILAIVVDDPVGRAAPAIGALLPPPKGTAKVLRELQVLGVINAKQFSAWNSMRHAVMHGSLVSPYSTQEEDKKLLLLAEMFRALTREMIRGKRYFAD